MHFENLFSPIKLRGLELKNRVLMPGMDTKFAHDHIGDEVIAYHVARVKGGCALNMFECTAVHITSRSRMNFGLYTEEQRDEFKKLTDAVHAAGGRIGVQLLHCGFVYRPFLYEGVRCLDVNNMSKEDIDEIVAAFGRSTALAVEAGFDTVEFHAAHTYLAHEFLTAAINRRTDEYGGSLENRARFALECIREMRRNMPEDMPLLMRVDVHDDYLENGLTVDDVAQFVNWAGEAGVDLADVSRGNILSFANVYEVPPINLPKGLNIDLIGELKSKVKDVAIATVGRIVEPEMAERARFTEATGFRVYFCDPHSPWQRGTNENTNGLLRQFFPKGTEFADVADEEVREAQDLLNGRPRETLGWRTPAEALAEELAKAGAMAA